MSHGLGSEARGVAYTVERRAESRIPDITDNERIFSPLMAVPEEREHGPKWPNLAEAMDHEE